MVFHVWQQYPSLKEVCTRCKTLDLEANPYISAHCVHVSSDQAPSQCKAHIELNNVSPNDLNDPNYRFYDFCRNCISALRHYRLTDMSGTFFEGLLSAVWASSTNEARKMKSVAPASVFTFREPTVMKLGIKQSHSH